MGVLTRKYDIVIGIDLGNGLIKIRTAYKNGKPYLLTQVSAYANFTELGDALEERSYNLEVFEMNGQKFLWGKDVINLKGEIVHCHGHAKRYNSIAYKNMVKMVLAKIYKDLGITSNDSVLIVTGVPSSETGSEAEELLVNAFTNNGEAHDVIVDGEQLFIKIAKEDVIVMAQPVATVVGRYLNDNGNVGDKRYAEMTVAVVDIGGGTTDFDIVRGMSRVTKLAYSEEKGFRDVYDAIRADIQSVYRTAKPTDYDLLKCLMVGGASGEFTYRPNLQVEPHDFKEALDKSVKDLSAIIQNQITGTWKSQADIDELLLVGGSASYFEEDIADIIEGSVKVPTNNANSNVDGYYKLGVSENNKMMERVV